MNRHHVIPTQISARLAAAATAPHFQWAESWRDCHWTSVIAPFATRAKSSKSDQKCKSYGKKTQKCQSLIAIIDLYDSTITTFRVALGSTPNTHTSFFDVSERFEKKKKKHLWNFRKKIPLANEYALRIASCDLKLDNEAVRVAPSRCQPLNFWSIPKVLALILKTCKRRNDSTFLYEWRYLTQLQGHIWAT